MKTGIYIHIPFCKAKCFYCDFLSFTHTSQIEAYKNALIKEIAANKNGIELVETVYIGGGTPTSLPPYYLLEIIEAVKAYPLSFNAEFTIEANPGTVNRDYLSALKKAGANRLSFGLQTTNDLLLKKIGRIHTYEEFQRNYSAAREVGFENINIDLMFALPSEDMNILQTDLTRITSLAPEHISAYPLMIEQGTPFESLEPIPEDLDREMYETVKSCLHSAGYNHYEISNFSKPGYISRHNTSYWQRKNYLGMGLGAHSFTGRLRYSNTVDLSAYIKSDGNPKKLLQSPDWITRTDALEEFFFLGLRLRQGVSLSEFYEEFNKCPYDIYGENIDKMISLKLLTLNGDKLRLTDKGIDVSNYVFSGFITASEQPRS